MKLHLCEKIKYLDHEQELDDPIGYKIDSLRDICYGNENMKLQIHFIGQNGIEDIIEDAIEIPVDFCPFCGIKSQPERLNPEASKEDAIV